MCRAWNLSVAPFAISPLFGRPIAPLETTPPRAKRAAPRRLRRRMPTNAALTEDTRLRASLETLREVVEALAPLEREAGSEGEREAAEWLAARLTAAGARGAGRRGGVPRRLAPTCTPASRGRGGLGARRARRPRARAALAGGAAAAALIADDAPTARGRAPGVGRAQDDLERRRRARRPRRRADLRRHRPPRRRPRRRAFDQTCSASSPTGSRA